jgi:hypothetical protein
MNLNRFNITQSTWINGKMNKSLCVSDFILNTSGTLGLKTNRTEINK